MASQVEVSQVGRFPQLKRDLPGLVASVLVHLLALAGIALITVAGSAPDAFVAIESIFSDSDRTAEQFSQNLDTSTEVAESLNFVAGGGGLAAAAGGSGGPAVHQGKIDASETLQDPTLGLNTGDVALPGMEVLGRDLGESQISGEVGAIVDGYGTALDRITQELIRMMRESKVLVVWLFDESLSMKDDQADIRARFHKIYEELKLVDDESRDKVLLTSIVSFGKEVHFQLPKKKPTDSIPEIMRAIDAIPVDESGVENTCHAIVTALSTYRTMHTQARRKIVLIVVSDESGDDGERVEDALQLARTLSAPIYFMGRESVFGYPYLHIRWIHPQTSNLHLLPIRRGPETPFAELLQFDGFRRRQDAALSGFGPYEQVRLARDSGGIFFMLPGEEQDVHDSDARRFAALDLKEYEPDIDSRRAYAAARDASPFRRAIWDAISLMNPYEARNKDMDIPVDHWYPITLGEAAPQVAATLARCVNTLQQLTEAERRLKAVEGQRVRESSRRWRADYDLMVGQVMAYRVRLFQFMVALEQFSRDLPTHKFANKMSNAWRVGIGTGEMLRPDEVQMRATKVTAEDLARARQSAQKQFSNVQAEHPNTPWAHRAAWEATRGYGMTFFEHYFPPPPKNPPPPPKTPIAPIPNL